jgi:hypothetical protein
VLAAAVRLTDLGFFRSGGDEYAADNGSFGLATIRREHVTSHRDEITFDYVGKSRKRHVQVIAGLFATEPDGELVSAWQRLGGRGPAYTEMPLAWAPDEDACGPDVKRHLQVAQQFVDAGFDHLVTMNAGPDPDGFIDFFGSELAVPLRALTPSAAS